MAIRPIIVLATLIFSLVIYNAFAPALLGAFGERAKEGPGTNGEGFSVNDSLIDRQARIGLVVIPSGMLFVVGVWGVLSLLITLAYLGVG